MLYVLCSGFVVFDNIKAGNNYIIIKLQFKKFTII